MEVGAASGYNLSLYDCKKRLGIEPSALNCKLAKENYGVDMFNGMWSEFLASNPNEKFDLIFMSGVLEHIVNPMQFIKECTPMCNRYMFIEVPCFDIKFVDEPYGMFSDEHVNIFSIQSLWNLMDRAGFAPIEFEIIFDLEIFMPAGWPSISTLWEKATNTKSIYDSGACLDRYLKENETLLKAIDKKIDLIPADEKIALWGTGNNLHKLLANTSLANKNIVRVYDSDKHKHGFKVMGVSVTPFNADDIFSGEVDAILITTYTAQRTIYKVIEKMNLPCKVYTLYDT